MPLLIHLSIHFILAISAGYLVYKIWSRLYTSLVAALIGGVLIDLDHLIDYYIAFGLNFRLDHIISGFEFLKNEKIYLFFHAWEYVAIFMILAFFLKNKSIKSIFLGLAMGILLHLVVDIYLNGMTYNSYLLTKRIKNNFLIEKIVDPDDYQKFLNYRNFYQGQYD
jgi:hypothetical protein